MSDEDLYLFQNQMAMRVVHEFLGSNPKANDEEERVEGCIAWFTHVDMWVATGESDVTEPESSGVQRQNWYADTE